MFFFLTSKIKLYNKTGKQINIRYYLILSLFVFTGICFAQAIMSKLYFSDCEKEQEKIWLLECLKKKIREKGNNKHEIFEEVGVTNTNGEKRC